MEEQFNPGDIVQLKSGGPQMTVQGAAGGKVSVVWYIGRDPYFVAYDFDPAVLLKSEA